MGTGTAIAFGAHRGDHSSCSSLLSHLREGSRTPSSPAVGVAIEWNQMLPPTQNPSTSEPQTLNPGPMACSGTNSRRCDSEHCWSQVSVVKLETLIASLNSIGMALTESLRKQHGDYNRARLEVPANTCTSCHKGRSCTQLGVYGAWAATHRQLIPLPNLRARAGLGFRV